MKRVKHLDVKAGIWVDTDNAIVVKMEGEAGPLIQIVESEIESGVRFPGEGKIFTRFGNTFVNDEEKKERKLQQQLKKYYKKISGLIADADYLCIYGPGMRKLELQHYLKNESHFKGKLLSCANEGKTKTEQFADKVFRWFNGSEFRAVKKNEKKKSGAGNPELFT